MADAQEYLTKEKFEEFKKELEFLKKTKRKEVAQNLEYAKALGDLAENAEYHEARDMQASVEDRITKLEIVLKNATIVSSHNSSAVSVGSIVTAEKGGKAVIYTVVGSEEADMAIGKISNKSPFGIAVLGKKKGESFSFKTPSGSATWKIVDIK